MMATNLILVVPTFENLGAYTTVGTNSTVALEEQDEIGCGALTKPSEIDACDNYVPASLNDIYAQHDRYTFFRYPVCPNCQGIIPFDRWLKTSEREIKVPHVLLRASPKFEYVPAVLLLFLVRLGGFGCYIAAVDGALPFDGCPGNCTVISRG